MLEFILRPALASDAGHIRDLIHRVGINPLDLDWRRFTIAEGKDGMFLGCAQLKQHADGSFEFASLAVQQEYRGQGLARALIQHFLAHSPRPLYLMCRPGLTPFYEKYGFQVIQPEEMPPDFRRLHRLVGILGKLTKHSSPAIMCLEVSWSE